MSARHDPHADRNPELGVDSDLEVSDTTSGAPGAAHPRPRFLLLVAVGGALGTGLREALSLTFPPVSGVSVTTGVINVVGAFVLGLLLEFLSGRGEDSGRRRDLRLFAGTGVLGGFTTYSALATDTVLLGDTERFVAAGSYTVGTLVLGLAAAALGIALGRRIIRSRVAGSSP